MKGYYEQYPNLTLIRDTGFYPLQHSDRIIVQDTTGLEKLLERTRQGNNHEWGTFLRVYDKELCAVVHDICDIDLAHNVGLIADETSDSARININKAEEMGYNGGRHFHPDFGPRWFGAHNFAVGLFDKFRPRSWVNLLTFNMPEGPEIIGFNMQYTYIPSDSTKRELVRATPVQIMKYLRV